MQYVIDQAAAPAIWILSVILSGIVGWYIKAMLDRGRSAIEIASINVDDRLHDDRLIIIPGAILEAYRDLAITISDLDETMPVSLVQKARDYVVLTINQAADASSALDDSISILDSLSIDTEKKTIRERVMNRLAQSGAFDIMAVISRGVMNSDFSKEISKSGGKEDYSKHPGIDELGNFGLTEFRHGFWTFSEDHSQEADDNWAIGTNNLMKRVFIYCEKPVLKRMLEASQSDLNAVIAKLTAFCNKLNEVIASNLSRRVWVEVVLSNHGRTPDIFDGRAFLDIDTATEKYAVALVRAEQVETSPVVVKANDSQVILLKSAAPIEAAPVLIKTSTGSRSKADDAPEAFTLVSSTSHKFRVALTKRGPGGSNREFHSDFFVQT